MKDDRRIIGVSVLVALMLTAFVTSFNSFIKSELNNEIYILFLIMITFLIIFSNKYELLNCSGLFIIFYILFIGIGPITLNNKNYNYSFNAHVVILLALVMFFLGNIIFLIFEKKYSLFDGKIEYKDNEIIIKKKKIATYLLVISILSWIKFIQSNIGILLADMENGRVLAMQGNGKIIYFIYLSMLAVWLFFDGYINEKNITTSKMISIVVLTSFMLFTLGFRSRIVELLLVMLLMYNNKKKVPIKKIVIFGIVAVFIVIGLYYIRIVISGQNRSTLKQLIYNLVEVNNINLSYIIRRFPSYVPFQKGYTYLINIMMLKPGPDLDFTLWLKEALNIQFNGAGVTPTILGEFYINFGYIGIYIGMFVAGIFCKIIDMNTRNFSKNIINSITILYICRSITGGITNNLLLYMWFIIIYIIVDKFLLKRKIVM